MLDGMGMMLKALGLDPETLQSGLQIAEAKIQSIENSLARIEEKLDRLLTLAPAEGVTDGRNSNQN